MIQPPESLSIGELLSSRTAFFVHTYQRAYAWEEPEITDFTTDIKRVYEAKFGGTENELKHFLGGIVSIKHESAGIDPLLSFEVVDGQQRLATCTLAIAQIVIALRSIATQEDEGTDLAAKASLFADQTESRYLKYKRVDFHAGKSDEPKRLTLSKVDKDFFSQLVDGNEPNPSRSSHDRLLQANRQLRQELLCGLILEKADLSVEDKLDCLMTLRSAILDNCSVIHITSDDRSEAYRLFAILNDRGRSLTDGDLLRAFTLELLDQYHDLQVEAEEAWNSVLEPAPRAVDAFLRSYYASVMGKRSPRIGLHDCYREEIFESPQLGFDQPAARQLTNRINNLATEIDPYQEIAAGRWPYNPSTVPAWDRQRLFYLIQTLGHDLCLPLLMSAHKMLSEAQFSEVVLWIEKFYFRYKIVVSAHTSPMNELYYRHARDMRGSSSYSLDTLRADLSALLERRASDSIFERALAENFGYQQGASQANRRVKYYLAFLEDHYRWYDNGAPYPPTPTRTHVFDLDQLTIEHIYPQNPPVGGVVPGLEDCKHSIGNLSFWGPNDNRAAGNDTFENKKVRYANSGIALTRALSTLPTWDENAFAARQKRLIEMSMKIFAL